MRDLFGLAMIIAILGGLALATYRVPRSGLKASVRGLRCEPAYCDVDVEIDSERSQSSGVGLRITIYSVIAPRVGGYHYVGYKTFVGKLAAHEKRALKFTVPIEGRVRVDLLKADADAYVTESEPTGSMFEPADRR